MLSILQLYYRKSISLSHGAMYDPPSPGDQIASYSTREHWPDADSMLAQHWDSAGTMFQNGLVGRDSNHFFLSHSLGNVTTDRIIIPVPPPPPSLSISLMQFGSAREDMGHRQKVIQEICGDCKSQCRTYNYLLKYSKRFKNLGRTVFFVSIVLDSRRTDMGLIGQFRLPCVLSENRHKLCLSCKAHSNTLRSNINNLKKKWILSVKL